MRKRKNKLAESAEEQKTPTITSNTQMITTGKVVDGRREEYDLEVEKFVTEPAYVRVEASQTRQLAEYESVKVSISVSLPCYKEQVEDTLVEASELAGEYLNKELDYYMGEGDEDGED